MSNTHDEADALDLIRTTLQLPLRQLKRRIQTSAEANLTRLKDEHDRDESEDKAPFDYLARARDAVSIAKHEWLGTELPKELSSSRASLES